jgi:predicted component of viral defense system (DUF524 family)
MSELADDVLKKKYSVHTKAAIENLDEYKRLTASKEAVTKEMSSKVEEAGKTLEEIEKKVASLQKEVETTAKSTASASTSSSCDTKKLLNDAVILTKETCNTIGSLDCAAYMARWLSGTDPAKLGPNPCEEEVQVKGDEK